MNRRAYLKEMASNYRDTLGPDADVLINKADEFTNDEVENLIAPLQKAKERERIRSRADKRGM